MTGIKQQLVEAEAALATLDEALGYAERSAIERDSALLRLVYTFWVIYKACRHFLAESEGVEAGSPDDAIRAARRLGWLSAEDSEAAIAAGRDRELAFEAYRAGIADQIVSRLSSHAAVLRRWLDALQEHAIKDA